MVAKPIEELKDNTYQSIISKSCSEYKDYFALDVPKWADILYKAQDKSYISENGMINKPSGR